MIMYMLGLILIFDYKGGEIIGSVYYPGKYTIKNSDEKISDIVKRAGGLRPEAYPLSSTFIRGNKRINIDLEQVIKQTRSKQDIVLLDGDRIIINTKTAMVSINGEINNPEIINIYKNQKIKDIILDLVDLLLIMIQNIFHNSS